MSRETERGSPQPRGANWDGNGTNFSLFSAHAERVQLCLFDPGTGNELERIDLEQSDQIWHVYLPGCGPGTVYGYRVHGPYAPEKGHRFNPYKLLLDPYARQLTGKLQWGPAVYGFELDDDQLDLSFNRQDSAHFMPKSVVVNESFDWGDDHAPRVSRERTVIYEAHVGGFTRLHPDIDCSSRGSFAAMGSPVILNYLQELGITTVELLPVHSFIDDHFLEEKDLVNYWGYNSIGFFAAESRYLSTGDRNEFKTMVKNLHAAGIEVILDVVYNHTAEGGQSGPTLSFRGIDNLSYYRLAEDDKRAYINDSGCGNTLNLNHPEVLAMVLDSLRHWVVDMHVDGFRFDLAVSLGREKPGFDSQGAFFEAIARDPVLSRVKLIAEPWDIGPGGYQLGAFPKGWAEWNDRYRDCLRRYWRGDSGVLPELARSLHGSSDLFEHNGRQPSASINLITSHDGFTLNDLVSYEERHNEVNGEDNRDGHNGNYSHNHGIEGETDDPEIRQLRARQRRNLLATLFLSQGTPMLLAGDELGRSQQGNNNAYCQDNAISWQDWSALQEEAELLDFVQRLIRLRASHPVLLRNHFVHGEEQFEPSGFSDIQWFRSNGELMQDSDWHDPGHNFLAMLLAGDANGDGDSDGAGQGALMITFNADPAPVDFTLPENSHQWHCIFTSAASQPLVTNNRHAQLEARSVQVFELKINGNGQHGPGSSVSSKAAMTTRNQQ